MNVFIRLFFSVCLTFAFVLFVFNLFDSVQTLFFLFQFMLVWSAWMTIFSLNPVYSVLFLVLVFLNGAALLFFLQLDFLAFSLVIVYVGAIAVLFLFVVMALNTRVLRFAFSSMHYFLLCIAVLVAFLQVLYYSLFFWNLSVAGGFTYLLQWSKVVSYLSSLQIVGQLVYGVYFVDLFLCSLMLLVAVLGAVNLTNLKGTPTYLSASTRDVYVQTLRDFRHVLRSAVVKSKKKH